MHKDIFVQADYMECLPAQNCGTPHTHQPIDDSITAIVQSFADAPVPNPDGVDGITLHVDCGPYCVMDPVTGSLWGDQVCRSDAAGTSLVACSRANALPHYDVLGTTNPGGSYNWSSNPGAPAGSVFFDDFKSGTLCNSGPCFPPERAYAFHYVIFVHDLPQALVPQSCGGCYVAGLSRGFGTSDFIVSLGHEDDNVGSFWQQAGTFMHELGHNLGLHHGGNDDINYKPNYLSVMNYLFQDSGLTYNGPNSVFNGLFDYSRFDSFSNSNPSHPAISSLDESNLDEGVGLNGDPTVANYQTQYFGVNCSQYPKSTPVPNPNSPIDWNCNGIIDPGFIMAEINNDTDQNGKPVSILSVLNSFNDWPNLVYTGGAIGGLGAGIGLPSVTPYQPEITPQLDSQITKIFLVRVTGRGIIPIAPGSSLNLNYTVINGGINPDTYQLQAGSTNQWADLSRVPANVALAPGASFQVPIIVSVPQGAVPGSTGQVTLKAFSQTSSTIFDNARIELIVTPPSGGGGSFNVTASPTSAAIKAGQSATYNLAVSPNGGSASVSLTCSVAPAGPNCSISPPSVTLNGSNSSSATVTVATIGSLSLASMASESSAFGRRFAALLPYCFVFATGSFLIQRPKARRAAVIIAIALLSTTCGGGGSQTSGGGSSGTPRGTYTITLTGTSGSNSQNTQVTLIVN